MVKFRDFISAMSYAAEMAAWADSIEIGHYLNGFPVTITHQCNREFHKGIAEEWDAVISVLHKLRETEPVKSAYIDVGWYSAFISVGASNYSETYVIDGVTIIVYF